VSLTFVVGKGRIRVERDPALCGRLNEEVGHLGGVTELINLVSLMFLFIVLIRVLRSLTSP
jgi:hypothetical protein